MTELYLNYLIYLMTGIGFVIVTIISFILFVSLLWAIITFFEKIHNKLTRKIKYRFTLPKRLKIAFRWLLLILTIIILIIMLTVFGYMIITGD